MATVTRYNANNTDIAQRFDEKTTAITAGTAGPTSNVSYDDRAGDITFQFKIPRITVTSSGRISAYSTSTITVTKEEVYVCADCSWDCYDCSSGDGDDNE